MKKRNGTDNKMETKKYHTIVTRRVSLMEQELTLPENLSSHPVFIGVRITRTLVICVYFADRFLSFCTFSFGHS
jgi:hypothetical protein